MSFSPKVIPTLTGKSAKRFIENMRQVERSANRIDFSKELAMTKAILEKASWSK